MDSSVFSVEGDLVIQVFTMIVLLSIIIERALAILFEWRAILPRIHRKGIKEPIALLTSLAVVLVYEFDAMAILFAEESNTYFGYLVTAGVIAGGSKGSIKLFKDWLGFQSTASRDLDSNANKDGGNAPPAGSRI